MALRFESALAETTRDLLASKLSDDTIDNGIDYSWALGLLFAALVLDALFGGLRKVSTESIPALQIIFIFTLGQFFFILVFWLIFGTDLSSQGYGYQVLYALLAGVNVQIAEYLFCVSTAYLKSSIATTCLSIGEG